MLSFSSPLGRQRDPKCRDSSQAPASFTFFFPLYSPSQWFMCPCNNSGWIPDVSVSLAEDLQSNSSSKHAPHSPAHSQTHTGEDLNALMAPDYFCPYLSRLCTMQKGSHRRSARALWPLCTHSYWKAEPLWKLVDAEHWIRKLTPLPTPPKKALLCKISIHNL